MGKSKTETGKVRAEMAKARAAGQDRVWVSVKGLENMSDASHKHHGTGTNSSLSSGTTTTNSTRSTNNNYNNTRDNGRNDHHDDDRHRNDRGDPNYNGKKKKSKTALIVGILAGLVVVGLLVTITWMATDSNNDNGGGNGSGKWDWIDASNGKWTFTDDRATKWEKKRSMEDGGIPKVPLPWKA